jgi:hypothetical protein
VNHEAARAAVDALFTGELKRGPELRRHLDGCLECRDYYDKTARSFRTISGNPEEMTAEELQLFAPAMPAMKVEEPVLARFIPWIGAIGAAATVALVAVVMTGKPTGKLPGEFQARGETKVKVQASVRPLCSRQEGEKVVIADPGAGACVEGDKLAFVASGRGNGYLAVAVLDGEKVEWISNGVVGTDEAPLSGASSWKPGLRAVVLLSDEPIEASDACAKGTCRKTVERTELPLSPGAPR